jgi:hypothetical protein
MKKIIIHAFVVSLIILSACGNPPAYDTAAQAPNAAFAAPASVADSSLSTPSLPASMPLQNIGALNPEHGKPNHRCDIAVGALLSSPVQPIQQAMPAQRLPSLPAATNGNSVARLNPAHGQPGHDCSVQVGQPLNN